MPEQIRFFLDEHIPATVAAGLRQRGVDVLTIQEAQRQGLSDSDQLQFAFTAGRVMVTFDPDYLSLADQTTLHSGIAWCPATKHTIGQLIRSLLLIHAVLDAEDMRNHIEYL